MEEIDILVVFLGRGHFEGISSSVCDYIDVS